MRNLLTNKRFKCIGRSSKYQRSYTETLEGVTFAHKDSCWSLNTNPTLTITVNSRHVRFDCLKTLFFIKEGWRRESGNSQII